VAHGTLTNCMAQLVERGPDRVVINEHGEATEPQSALCDHGVSAEVIFIRDDCWCLGAPSYLKSVAEGLWADEWIGVYDPRKREVLSYDEYKSA